MLTPNIRMTDKETEKLQRHRPMLYTPILCLQCAVKRHRREIILTFIFNRQINYRIKLLISELRLGWSLETFTLTPTAMWNNVFKNN